MGRRPCAGVASARLSGSLLERAGWVAAARKGDWARLPDMLAYLSRDDRNPVFAASLLRLIRGCPSSEKWPAIIAALEDDAPLVRSAAAEALDGFVTAASVDALMKACRDEYRLVGSMQPQAFRPSPRASLNRMTSSPSSRHRRNGLLR